MAYLTIQHDLDAVMEPPCHFAAFIERRHLKQIEEEKLCWSANAPTRNPATIDIYAGEKQMLDIGDFGVSGEWIEIPSEVGYASSQTESEAKEKDRIKSRAFLRGRCYRGTIKIVSSDTRRRIFHIEIDPAGRQHPLRLVSPDGHSLGFWASLSTWWRRTPQ